MSLSIEPHPRIPNDDPATSLVDLHYDLVGFITPVRVTKDVVETLSEFFGEMPYERYLVQFKQSDNEYLLAPAVITATRFSVDGYIEFTDQDGYPGIKPLFA